MQSVQNSCYWIMFSVSWDDLETFCNILSLVWGISLKIVVKLFSMGGLYSAFGLKAVSEDALTR